MSTDFILKLLLFNIVLVILANAIKQEKAITVIRIRKEEIKLLEGDMILYQGNPKVSRKKQLQTIKQFIKLASYVEVIVF